MAELGTLLGVRFEYDPYPVDGFQLKLTDVDYEKTLYDYRVIGATLWEAVTSAVEYVWVKEINKHNDWELPARVAGTLGIEETYFDDDGEED